MSRGRPQADRRPGGSRAPADERRMVLPIMRALLLLRRHNWIAFDLDVRCIASGLREAQRQTPPGPDRQELGLAALQLESLIAVRFQGPR